MTSSKYSTLIAPETTVRIVYRRADGDIQERIVDVQSLYTTKAGSTVFFGYCHKRAEDRCFSLANVLYAEVWDGSPIRSFTAQEALDASTARLMAAHRAAIIASEQNARSASQWAGWA